MHSQDLIELECTQELGENLPLLQMSVLPQNDAFHIEKCW